MAFLGKLIAITATIIGGVLWVDYLRRQTLKDV
jgi:hypothetical protein